MANAAKMRLSPRARVLVTGHPGAGKTGSLAALANAGFKLRVIDFDGNPESLMEFTAPEALANIDIVSLEDKISDTGDYTQVAKPSALRRAMQLMNRWRYEDTDGEELDEKTGKRYANLGVPAEWGNDTVVVVDGMTGLGAAAFNRARFVTNKTPLDTTRQVWGLGAADQWNFIKALCSDDNKFNVVMLSHLKLVGPKDVEKTDTQIGKTVKEQIADLIAMRWYPNALGQDLPKVIAGEFPVHLTIETDANSKTPRRRFHALPRPELDLKMPVRDLSKLTPDSMEVGKGMLTVFEALGVKPPRRG